MTGIVQVPPSLIIILDRIEYWREQQASKNCSQYKQLCESIISELEYIKELTCKKHS